MATSGMDQNRLINILGVATLDGTSFLAPTSPLKLQLDTTVGSETTDGTQLAASGGYVTGGATMGSNPFSTPTYSAGAASNSNANTVTWTNMPAAMINGIEIWDSAATPLRWWWGALTTVETTNSGDTLSFAIGSIVPSMSG
jgi:hypothetical protein